MGKDLMLFQPKKIGEMTVKNRIVRSATYEGMAKDGIVYERYVGLYSMHAWEMWSTQKGRKHAWTRAEKKLVERC